MKGQDLTDLPLGEGQEARGPPQPFSWVTIFHFQIGKAFQLEDIFSFL